MCIRDRFIGAFAPYGYKKDPNDKNSLIVDEEAAEIVKIIYHWFVNEGYSLSLIHICLYDMRKKALIGRLLAQPRGNFTPACSKQLYPLPATLLTLGLWL